MFREIKIEYFFCIRVSVIWYYNEKKCFNFMYNFIRFIFLGECGVLCFYLVIICIFMIVICEVYDYLGMFFRYLINKLGYEFVDCGYIFMVIELIEF